MTKMEKDKELIKSDWSIQSCFAEFRCGENAAIGMGAILLTIDQQVEICKMVDQFYIRKTEIII